VLIPVKLLLNGHSVVQMPTDRITYYYVELPAQGVVLAEGVEAESYLNSGDRGDFAEGQSFVGSEWLCAAGHDRPGTGCRAGLSGSASRRDLDIRRRVTLSYRVKPVKCEL